VLFRSRYHYVSFGLTNRVLMKKNDVKARAKEVFTWGISQLYYFDPSQSYLSYYKLEDGTIPHFTDLTNYVRFFPVGDFNLDFRVAYNTYKKMLSSVRASANLGTISDDLYLSLSWYRSMNPFYQTIFSNREQVGAGAGLKIAGLDLYADFQYNVRDKKMLYADLAAAWNWQCLDFKVDAQAYFFRDKPELQIRFSIGLGNITPSSDSLGPRASADNVALTSTGERRARG
jgi:LPS-assembly protein